MKTRIVWSLFVAMVAMGTSTLQAQEPIPAPPPAGEMPMADGTSVAPAIALYHNVRYKDLDNIAPCAVQEIVCVPDPCNRCGGVVYIAICVPPCGCAEIEIDDDGREIKYDYGDYEVEIKVEKDGRITVDYDD